MAANITVIVPSIELAYNKKNLKKVLRQAGNDVARVARAKIRKSLPTGKAYGGKNASAPGEPPASRTGQLAKSIRVRASRSGMAVRILDNAMAKDGMPYAIALEAGAVGGGGKGKANIGRSHKKGGSKGKVQTPRVLAPRPFLTTALQERESDIAQKIAESLKTGIEFKKIK